MPPHTIRQRLRHEHGLARAFFSITITEDFMQHHRIAHRKILLLDPRSNLLQFQIIELVVPDALASYRGAPCAAYHAEVPDHRDAHPAQLRTASDRACPGDGSRCPSSPLRSTISARSPRQDQTGPINWQIKELEDRFSGSVLAQFLADPGIAFAPGMTRTSDLRFRKTSPNRRGPSVSATHCQLL